MQADLSTGDGELNKIDVIPETLKVREAQHWQKKDTTKITDFSEVEVISDWTYSTPYKASVRFLSNERESIKNATALDIEMPGEPDPSAKITVEITDEEIPFHKLGPENPIVHSG